MRIIGNGGTAPRKVQAVASGALASGDTVIVNTDGTVSVVAGTTVSQSQGSVVSFSTNDIDKLAAAYDANAGKVVVIYRDVNNSGYGKSIIGTVSGTSISFGTAQTYQTSSGQQAQALTFDSANNKVVMYYADQTASGIVSARVGTVSGTSLSFGTKVALPGNPTAAGGNVISCIFDANAGKSVVFFINSANSNYGTACVGTVSGTSISFGSLSVFESANTNYPHSTFDSTNNKSIVVYRDLGNSSYGTAAVGTISGTSISFGTPVVYYSNTQTEHLTATFDTAAGKSVVVYRDEGNSEYLTARVGTTSGTSISFGTAVVVSSASPSTLSSTFDASMGKVVLGVQTGDDGDYFIGKVSGTSISFETPVEFTDQSPSPLVLVYSSGDEKIISLFKNNYNNDAYSRVLATGGVTTNLTSENFIGFSSNGYASGQAATINTKGFCGEVGQSSLTAGQSYFVQTNGDLGLTAADPSVFAGTAVSAIKLIVKG
tara:strand:- start:1482 stop:2945 length:1464 start_codon:yes stop_codon:yes gene_type:complete